MPAKKDHTIEHLRDGKLIHPEPFECLSLETWLASGAKILVSAAREKVNAILKSHEIPPLPQEVAIELHYIQKGMVGESMVTYTKAPNRPVALDR